MAIDWFVFVFDVRMAYLGYIAMIAHSIHGFQFFFRRFLFVVANSIKRKRDTNRNMKKKNLDNIRVDQVEATGTRNGPKMCKHTHLYRAYLLIL